MSLLAHFPATARELITVSRQDLMEVLGPEVLGGVVGGVLLGENIRDVTEPLTKRRLHILNAALLATHLRLRREGASLDSVLRRARQELLNRSRTDADGRKALRWLLGLTKKQVDNVLRSDDRAWHEYVSGLTEGLREAGEWSDGTFGETDLKLSDEEVEWEWILAVMMSAGAQTLGTRGAEKSLYGKLFERLILFAALRILGFQYDARQSLQDRSFWLSSHGEKRESDATAVWKRGEAVRFDIGFIGRGNPEISLDKVSRFERMSELGQLPFRIHTFIIVDTVADGSSIVEIAKEMDGTIIQMSANNWLRTLGEQLEEVLSGFESPLRGLSGQEYRAAVRAGVERAGLADAV